MSEKTMPTPSRWKPVKTPRMKANAYMEALQNRRPCPAGCENGMQVEEERKSYGVLRKRIICQTCNGQGRVGEVKFDEQLKEKDLRG